MHTHRIKFPITTECQTDHIVFYNKHKVERILRCVDSQTLLIFGLSPSSKDTYEALRYVEPLDISWELTRSISIIPQGERRLHFGSKYNLTHSFEDKNSLLVNAETFQLVQPALAIRAGALRKVSLLTTLATRRIVLDIIKRATDSKRIEDKFSRHSLYSIMEPISGSNEEPNEKNAEENDKNTNSNEKYETRNSRECQTNISVHPHILSSGAKANVYVNAGVQTSCTINPTDSNTGVDEKLAESDPNVPDPLIKYPVVENDQGRNSTGLTVYGTTYGMSEIEPTENNKLTTFQPEQVNQTQLYTEFDFQRLINQCETKMEKQLLLAVSATTKSLATEIANLNSMCRQYLAENLETQKEHYDHLDPDIEQISELDKYAFDLLTPDADEFPLAIVITDQFVGKKDIEFDLPARNIKDFDICYDSESFGRAMLDVDLTSPATPLDRNIFTVGSELPWEADRAGVNLMWDTNLSGGFIPPQVGLTKRRDITIFLEDYVQHIMEDKDLLVKPPSNVKAIAQQQPTYLVRLQYDTDLGRKPAKLREHIKEKILQCQCKLDSTSDSCKCGCPELQIFCGSNDLPTVSSDSDNVNDPEDNTPRGMFDYDLDAKLISRPKGTHSNRENAGEPYPMWDQELIHTSSITSTSYCMGRYENNFYIESTYSNSIHNWRLTEYEDYEDYTQRAMYDFDLIPKENIDPLVYLGKRAMFDFDLKNPIPDKHVEKDKSNVSISTQDGQVMLDYNLSGDLIDKPETKLSATFIKQYQGNRGMFDVDLPTIDPEDKRARCGHTNCKCGCDKSKSIDSIPTQPMWDSYLGRNSLPIVTWERKKVVSEATQNGNQEPCTLISQPSKKSVEIQTDIVLGPLLQSSLIGCISDDNSPDDLNGIPMPLTNLVISIDRVDSQVSENENKKGNLALSYVIENTGKSAERNEYNLVKDDRNQENATSDNERENISILTEDNLDDEHVDAILKHLDTLSLSDQIEISISQVTNRTASNQSLASYSVATEEGKIFDSNSNLPEGSLPNAIIPNDEEDWPLKTWKPCPCCKCLTKNFKDPNEHERPKKESKESAPSTSLHEQKMNVPLVCPNRKPCSAYTYASNQQMTSECNLNKNTKKWIEVNQQLSEINSQQASVNNAVSEYNAEYIKKNKARPILQLILPSPNPKVQNVLEITLKSSEVSEILSCPPDPSTNLPRQTGGDNLQKNLKSFDESNFWSSEVVRIDNRTEEVNSLNFSIPKSISQGSNSKFSNTWSTSSCQRKIKPVRNCTPSSQDNVLIVLQQKQNNSKYLFEECKFNERLIQLENILKKYSNNPELEIRSQYNEIGANWNYSMNNVQSQLHNNTNEGMQIFDNSNIKSNKFRTSDTALESLCQNRSQQLLECRRFIKESKNKLGSTYDLESGQEAQRIDYPSEVLRCVDYDCLPYSKQELVLSGNQSFQSDNLFTEYEKELQQLTEHRDRRNISEKSFPNYSISSDNSIFSLTENSLSLSLLKDSDVSIKTFDRADSVPQTKSLLTNQTEKSIFKAKSSIIYELKTSMSNNNESTCSIQQSCPTSPYSAIQNKISFTNESNSTISKKNSISSMQKSVSTILCSSSQSRGLTCEFSSYSSKNSSPSFNVKESTSTILGSNLKKEGVVVNHPKSSISLTQQHTSKIESLSSQIRSELKSFVCNEENPAYLVQKSTSTIRCSALRAKSSMTCMPKNSISMTLYSTLQTKNSGSNSNKRIPSSTIQTSTSALYSTSQIKNSSFSSNKITPSSTIQNSTTALYPTSQSKNSFFSSNKITPSSTIQKSTSALYSTSQTRNSSFISNKRTPCFTTQKSSPAIPYSTLQNKGAFTFAPKSCISKKKSPPFAIQKSPSAIQSSFPEKKSVLTCLSKNSITSVQKYTSKKKSSFISKPKSSIFKKKTPNYTLRCFSSQEKSSCTARKSVSGSTFTGEKLIDDSSYNMSSISIPESEASYHVVDYNSDLEKIIACHDLSNNQLDMGNYIHSSISSVKKPDLQYSNSAHKKQSEKSGYFQKISCPSLVSCKFLSEKDSNSYLDLSWQSDYSHLSDVQSYKKKAMQSETLLAFVCKDETQQNPFAFYNYQVYASGFNIPQNLSQFTCTFEESSKDKESISSNKAYYSCNDIIDINDTNGNCSELQNNTRKNTVKKYHSTSCMDSKISNSKRKFFNTSKKICQCCTCAKHDPDKLTESEINKKQLNRSSCKCMNKSSVIITVTDFCNDIKCNKASGAVETVSSMDHYFSAKSTPPIDTVDDYFNQLNTKDHTPEQTASFCSNSKTPIDNTDDYLIPLKTVVCLAKSSKSIKRFISDNNLKCTIPSKSQGDLKSMQLPDTVNNNWASILNSETTNAIANPEILMHRNICNLSPVTSRIYFNGSAINNINESIGSVQIVNCSDCCKNVNSMIEKSKRPEIYPIAMENSLVSENTKYVHNIEKIRTANVPERHQCSAVSRTPSHIYKNESLKTQSVRKINEDNIPNEVELKLICGDTAIFKCAANSEPVLQTLFHTSKDKESLCFKPNLSTSCECIASKESNLSKQATPLSFTENEWHSRSCQRKNSFHDCNNHSPSMTLSKDFCKSQRIITTNLPTTKSIVTDTDNNNVIKTELSTKSVQCINLSGRCLTSFGLQCNRSKSQEGQKLSSSVCKFESKQSDQNLSSPLYQCDLKNSSEQVWRSVSCNRAQSKYESTTSSFSCASQKFVECKCEKKNLLDQNLNSFSYKSDKKIYGSIFDKCSITISQKSSVASQTERKCFHNNIVEKAIVSYEKEIRPLKEALLSLQTKIKNLNFLDVDTTSVNSILNKSMHYPTKGNPFGCPRTSNRIRECYCPNNSYQFRNLNYHSNLIELDPTTRNLAFKNRGYFPNESTQDYQQSSNEKPSLVQDTVSTRGQKKKTRRSRKRSVSKHRKQRSSQAYSNVIDKVASSSTNFMYSEKDQNCMIDSYKTFMKIEPENFILGSTPLRTDPDTLFPWKRYPKPFK